MSPEQTDALIILIVSMVLIIYGIILTFICSDDDETDAATDTPQRDVMSREYPNVIVRMTSEEAYNPLIHESMSTIAIAHSNFNNGIISSSRQHTRVNVPPMARRQNSLPSYDEAVIMASPPPTQ